MRQDADDFRHQLDRHGLEAGIIRGCCKTGPGAKPQKEGFFRMLFLITCLFQTHFDNLYHPPFFFAPLQHPQGQLQNFPAKYAVKRGSCEIPAASSWNYKKRVN
jgi:hypothetical protein